MKDYHIHSIYSEDGQYTPAQLVEQCASAGITEMAIADHNTVRGVPEGLMAAEKAGIHIIPAIEIDCSLDQTNLHILGYGIDIRRPEYDVIENRIRNQCIHVSSERLKRMQELGFHISREELVRAVENPWWPESWTGEMFAEVLLKKPGEAGNPALAPYREGGNRSDNPYVNFYWDYCAQGKPAYVPWQYPDAAEIIEVIHQTGGKAVLAHPGNNLGDEKEMLWKIIGLGLDGIEAFSSYHRPEQSAFFRKVAEKAGLFVTYGSDYHGKTKPEVRLGGHGFFGDSQSILCNLQDKSVKKNIDQAKCH